MNNPAFAVGCKPEITVSRAIPQMATIQETTRLFGLPENLVRQKVLNGEIVAISAGRRYLVNVDKFADYLNINKLPAPNERDEPAERSGIYPIPAKL